MLPMCGCLCQPGIDPTASLVPAQGVSISLNGCLLASKPSVLLPSP